MSLLIVDLYNHRLRALSGERGTFDFVADDEAIRRHGVGSTVLSFVIPLTSSPRPSDVGIRRNFFEEILAEGTARSRLGGNARIDDTNTMALLRRYGRDVAGAVQLWDPDDPQEPRTPSTAPVTAARIREILSEVKLAPIGNTTERRMSSLAGVQDKIVLALTDSGWAEPLDGYPSSHIIKPVVGALPTLIFDEEYGARIARSLGLSLFDTQIAVFDGIPALVIERYDRSAGGRIHQEDMNQALGFRGDAKYEAHGNPGLATIAALLRENIGRVAVATLLRMTTLSIAVGNLDMHAKNISVMHREDGTSELAPMYDIVPQMHQPFDKDFAFSVNGVFAHNAITRSDLVAEGQRWGLRDAARIVDATIANVAQCVKDQQPVSGAHHSLAHDISRYCQNLAEGRGASASHSGTSSPIASAAKPAPEATAHPFLASEGGWGGPGRP